MPMRAGAAVAAGGRGGGWTGARESRTAHPGTPRHADRRRAADCEKRTPRLARSAGGAWAGPLPDRRVADRYMVRCSLQPPAALLSISCTTFLPAQSRSRYSGAGAIQLAPAGQAPGFRGGFVDVKARDGCMRERSGLSSGLKTRNRAAEFHPTDDCRRGEPTARTDRGDRLVNIGTRLPGAQDKGDPNPVKSEFARIAGGGADRHGAGYVLPANALPSSTAR